MTRAERARKLGVPIEELPDGRGKHGRHARGKRHPRWNAGIATSSHGYLKVQVGPEHPFADPNGYAYLHALVWYAAKAAPDDRGDHIHHRDEDKLNNRLSNLAELTPTAHAEHHTARRQRDEAGRLTGGSRPGTALEDLPEDLRIREFPACGRPGH